MKKIKNFVLSLSLLGLIVFFSGFSQRTNTSQEFQILHELGNQEFSQNQTINMFVTHGHCSTPFGGIVDNLNVNVQSGLGNMEISFEVDPNSFNVSVGNDLTSRVKTPGLFIGDNNENIIFKSTNIYTMGLDWYQVNGTMSIKGIEKQVKLFVTGIRDPKGSMASSLVLEGQINLFDWGIDYDKIVTGKSETIATQWMYINMKIDMC